MKCLDLSRMAALALLVCAPLFAEDPYEPKIVFDFGPNEGKEADLSARRSILKLPPEEAAKYGAAEGDTVVANFFHDGKFWIAKIPKDGVQDLNVQVWKFNKIPPLSHDQLRFTMKPGKEVTLYPQNPQDASSEEKLSDIVFSMEAIYPKGGASDFGIKTGTNGSFLSAYRFKSQKEDYFERVLSAKLKVRQVRTNLTPEQRNKALQDALQLSHDSQMNVKYHLTRKSCTTVAYEILDGVSDYGPLRQMFALVNWLPNWPEWHLYWRGLLPRDGKPVNLPTVNEEFADYAKDRGMKRRLVEMLRESKEARNEAREARRNAPKGIIGQCGVLLAKLKFW